MSQRQRNRIALGLVVVAVAMAAWSQHGMTQEERWQMVRASFGGVCGE